MPPLLTTKQNKFDDEAYENLSKIAKERAINYVKEELAKVETLKKEKIIINADALV